MEGSGRQTPGSCLILVNDPSLVTFRRPGFLHNEEVNFMDPTNDNNYAAESLACLGINNHGGD